MIIFTIDCNIAYHNRTAVSRNTKHGLIKYINDIENYNKYLQNK